MKFNVKGNNQLNEISEYALQKSFDEFNKIKTNYKELKEDAYKIACYCINDDLTKPTTIYNLMFCVELNLKYYLLISSNLNIAEIEELGHDINKLINEAKKNMEEDLEDFDDLNNLLGQFKTSKNKTLNFSEYENFKYNKPKRTTNLIFNNYNIDSKEKENIKEVLKWLDLHM